MLIGACNPIDDTPVRITGLQAAGNLMMLLTKLMPKVIEIIGPIIVPLGFTGDQPGVMKFVAATNPYQGNPDIAVSLPLSGGAWVRGCVGAWVRRRVRGYAGARAREGERERG